MSDKLENQIFIKINGNFHKKNRKYIKENLIRYDEKKYEGEFLELMRMGYEEMSQINLELSEAIDFSKGDVQYKFDDICEYEKWLCGVWEFKWRLW